MNISGKLTALACGAVAALLVVGGGGFYSAKTLDDALQYTSKGSIPNIQTVRELKEYQQALAIGIYRHLLTNKPEQMLAIEKSIEDAKKGVEGTLNKYEKLIRTPKGRELLDAEKAAVAEYFRGIPAVLEKSRANDKAGALNEAASLRAGREKLELLIDEHIALIGKNTETRLAQTEMQVRRNEFLSAAIILLAVGAIAAGCFFVIRGIGRSLNAMKQAIARIEGNLDFTVHAEVIGKDEIAEVSTAINRLLDKLRESLSAIAQGTNKVADASGKLAQAAEQVAASSTQQSDSAAAMAASVEEMSVSIAHVSNRSSEAHSIAGESGHLSREGEKVIAHTVEDINRISGAVGQVSTRIDELEASSSQISTIVSMIREVADQTNLLALNAAIEAARAGEQGRGFAVVADEVRKLAERTAVSTMEISSRIESIRHVSKDAAEGMMQAVEYVENGVRRAGDANDAIQKIGAGSHQSVAMVEEIAAAIRQQSEACSSIANNVERIARMAEESSMAARDSAVSAHELDLLAREMRNIVAAYRL